MKKLLLLLLAPIVLFSCNEDADPDRTLVGEWDLVSAYSVWTGATKVEDELDYQQTYQFRADGTFTKIQKMDDIVREAKGSYSTEQPEAVALEAGARLNVILNFTEGEELAGDCFGPNLENLVLNRNNELRNSWSACDGPGLTYEKK
ncbi:MAG TPA: hypothetical protein VLA71_06740 [Algoriphagus sp.]|nr:hypothetical protein [Algoriphagus sp.]